MKKKKTEDTEGEVEDIVLPNERTEYLKARKNDLGINSKIGKNVIISKEPGAKMKSPLYCNVCEIDFNDSLSYVDHLNGKRHNRILGMNMKVETITVDRIEQKLMQLSNKGPKKVVIDEVDEVKDGEIGKRDAIEENEDGDGIEEEGEEESELDDDMKEMAAFGLPTKFK